MDKRAVLKIGLVVGLGAILSFTGREGIVFAIQSASQSTCDYIEQQLQNVFGSATASVDQNFTDAQCGCKPGCGDFGDCAFDGNSCKQHGKDHIRNFAICPGLGSVPYECNEEDCEQACNCCGNGVIDNVPNNPEECENQGDCNKPPQPGYNATGCNNCKCEYEKCGDGKLNGPEQCEPGVVNCPVAGQNCVNCKCAPVCGDGVVIAPETCDPPGNLGQNCKVACRASCNCCGDGIVNGGEICEPNRLVCEVRDKNGVLKRTVACLDNCTCPAPTTPDETVVVVGGTVSPGSGTEYPGSSGPGSSSGGSSSGPPSGSGGGSVPPPGATDAASPCYDPNYTGSSSSVYHRPPGC